MSSEIFVRAGPGETRYAMTVQGVLTRQFIHRAKAVAPAGAVYRGRITKIHPGLNSAFVNLGSGQEGFLPAADAQVFDPAREKPKPISALFSEGQTILVQVQREGYEDKRPRLTTRVNVASQHLVMTPSQPGIFLSKKISGEDDRALLQELLSAKLPPDCGVIVRTDARETDAAHLLKELGQLSRNWSAALDADPIPNAPSLFMNPPSPLEHLLAATGEPCDKIVTNSKGMLRSLSDIVENLYPAQVCRVETHNGKGDIFEDYDILDQWAALYERAVFLPSGGRILIDEAAAVTAIDVDSGGGSSSRRGEALALATNLEAAADIGRHIQLRELAGQIVIDFLPLRRTENQSSVKMALTQSMGSGVRDVHFFGFSAMGLFELTRRRRRKSFHDLNLIPGSSTRHPVSLAYDILYRLKHENRAHPGRAVCVRCASDVATLLRKGKLAPYLVDIEKQFVSPVEFQTESRHDFDIVGLSVTS